MTWAAQQPRGARWHRTRTAVATEPRVRAAVRPLGASIVGFLAMIAAGWGAVAVFWGPNFGYYPTTTTAWSWTTQNWLLHVVPGAVGVFAGLLVLGLSPARRLGAPAVIGLPALLLIAAGAWFVIGPALWATFESGTPFLTGTTATRSFANQIGTSLGPGLLLAVFGGMALKAGIARPAIVEPAPAAAAPIAGPAVAETTATPVVEDTRAREVD